MIRNFLFSVLLIASAITSPVWMAPALQGFCDAWRQVRSGLVSGLLMRLTWPLALMGSADRGPFCFADS